MTERMLTNEEDSSAAEGDKAACFVFRVYGCRRMRVILVEDDVSMSIGGRAVHADSSEMME